MLSILQEHDLLPSSMIADYAASFYAFGWPVITNWVTNGIAARKRETGHCANSQVAFGKEQF